MMAPDWAAVAGEVHQVGFVAQQRFGQILQANCKVRNKIELIPVVRLTQSLVDGADLLAEAKRVGVGWVGGEEQDADRGFDLLRRAQHLDLVDVLPDGYLAGDVAPDVDRVLAVAHRASPNPLTEKVSDSWPSLPGRLGGPARCPPG